VQSSKTSPPTDERPVFLQAGCPSCHPTNSVTALEDYTEGKTHTNLFIQRIHHVRKAGKLEKHEEYQLTGQVLPQLKTARIIAIVVVVVVTSSFISISRLL